MNPTQQALLHLANVALALAAVTGLAVTGHLSGEALTLVVALAGIGGTGIAGTTTTQS